MRAPMTRLPAVGGSERSQRERSQREKGGSMSARPDESAPSGAGLLGERAYPESQVTHGGVTYWLERARDGGKCLLAVAEDESALAGFVGSTERIDGAVRLEAETTPENASALRSALPWL